MMTFLIMLLIAICAWPVIAFVVTKWNRRQTRKAFCNWRPEDAEPVTKDVCQLPLAASRESHALVEHLLADPELTEEAKAIVRQAADELGEDMVAKLAQKDKP